MGMSADEILTTLPHLKPSQVHSALAYYFDHKDEVDTDAYVLKQKNKGKRHKT
jgi:uncharacterized protein (DUF433 family)